MSEEARYGWGSDFPTFKATPPSVVREALKSFLGDPSPEQVRAWSDSIPPLQNEVAEILASDLAANGYSAILEYELPMEARRPDVILLVGSGIVVLELKGKWSPSRADLDQVAAYARDLRAYHRECADRPVIPVLVPTLARGYQQVIEGIHVTGPDALDSLISTLSTTHIGTPVSRASFLSESAYRPLPSIVEAARELFSTGSLRTIHRARAATGPVVDHIARIVHQAALTNSRHLVLLTGVPGAGKTLVGLQAVHAHYLDELAAPRDGERPSVPAVFLSGNGPLVEVLQYELRQAGGGGKAFVRHVQDYVRRYSKSPTSVPPEHVLVFDEAQRAFDAAKMQLQHKSEHAKSEPEEFIGFADRIPAWCVVVGLIGTGQEIHIGEEAGLEQWRLAVEKSQRQGEWSIHCPPQLAPVFPHADTSDLLNLTSELRYHLASDLHRFVELLLADGTSADLRSISSRLEEQGYHLRITREVETAKAYLRDRYADDVHARFGIIASSRDKDLPRFGINNDFQATKQVRFGPWYGDDEYHPDGRSCRCLRDCVTEFGAQGLELDATLLAWGTDFERHGDVWSNQNARKYQKASMIRDAMQLRRNAYRVLLTRARDATVVFVPPLPRLEETYSYLVQAGFVKL